MRRVLLRVVGWLLVLGGVVLYPLPGPGLLLVALGLGLLSRHDPWAERRLGPVRDRALRDTARSVATRRRTTITTLVTVAVGASGVLWLWDPARPAWWILPAWTWLPGGLWAGVGQIVTGVVGLAIVVWARRSLVPRRAAWQAEGMAQGAHRPGPVGSR